VPGSATGPALVAEPALATADHNRVDHQPVLVDEALLEERLGQLRTAEQVQVGTVLRASAATASATSARERRGVRPRQRVAERS
jgi:hypothetical protein